MKSKIANPTFDPELATLLPALEGYVPVNMTPDRLAPATKVSTSSSR